jgi:hypothetical protein
LSGYTPVFKSVFQGSLCGKWPDCGVWLAMLALQDSRGEIDAHPSYIATVTGCPLEDVQACIERFCAPDESSRSPDEDGRRLIPLEGRGFGWRVVNHRKYREKARLAARHAQEAITGKNAQRMKDRRRPPQTAVTAADRPSDSDSNTDTNSEIRNKKARKRAPSSIPEDWQAGEELDQFARDRLPRVSLPDLWLAFTDYHSAKGTTSKDWSASARTWVANAAKFGYPMTAPAQRPPEKIIRYDGNGRVIDG